MTWWQILIVVGFVGIVLGSMVLLASLNDIEEGEDD